MLGRPNLYDNLSVRKPASYLVPDTFQNHELLIVLFLEKKLILFCNIDVFCVLRLNHPNEALYYFEGIPIDFLSNKTSCVQN